MSAAPLLFAPTASRHRCASGGPRHHRLHVAPAKRHRRRQRQGSVTSSHGNYVKKDEKEKWASVAWEKKERMKGSFESDGGSLVFQLFERRRRIKISSNKNIFPSFPLISLLFCISDFFWLWLDLYFLTATKIIAKVMRRRRSPFKEWRWWEWRRAAVVPLQRESRANGAYGTDATSQTMTFIRLFYTNQKGWQLIQEAGFLSVLRASSCQHRQPLPVCMQTLAKPSLS